MSNPTKIAETYIDSWNETDAGRRAARIAETFTPTAVYSDPMMRGEGHDGLSAMIAGAQAQFAGLRFRQVGKVDAYADRIRFSWELGPDEGPALAGGTDFGTIEDGRLATVVGFLDFAPQA